MGETLLAFIHPACWREAGVGVSFSRQGAEEDWELRPPQGRPEVSSYLAHTPAPLIPYPFPRIAPPGKAAAVSWLLWRKGRSRGGPMGEGGKPGGFMALAVRPRCSPCRTRRTHFPRWLGAATELVGMRIGRAGWRLPLARNEKTTPL